MKKILIIDDDVAFRDIMTTSLDSSLYEVSSAGNGKEGLQRMAESKPDMILLDIKMPRMSGLEFLKEVNKKYGEGKTPVLITSNLSTIDNISEGMTLGIRGYIVKSGESVQGIIDTIARTFE